MAFDYHPGNFFSVLPILLLMALFSWIYDSFRTLGTSLPILSRRIAMSCSVLFHDISTAGFNCRGYRYYSGHETCTCDNDETQFILQANNAMTVDRLGFRQA